MLFFPKPSCAERKPRGMTTCKNLLDITSHESSLLFPLSTHDNQGNFKGGIRCGGRPAITYGGVIMNPDFFFAVKPRGKRELPFPWGPNACIMLSHSESEETIMCPDRAE